jgi:hypothetical protein
MTSSIISIFVILLVVGISTSDLAYAQSYYNNSNTTSAKPPTVPKSPVLSDSEQRAIIDAAMSVPGLKAWSNQWKYGWMDFSGTTSGWQYAIVHLRLPVNASAPLSCVFPYEAAIKVDISTKQVVEAHYPTPQNFNCNLGCGGPIGYVCPTNNTIIKNTTAYNIYLANYGLNSTNQMTLSMSPLTQFKSGIAAKDVTCAQDLQLLIKAENGSPACVKPQTAQMLIERGWGQLP